MRRLLVLAAAVRREHRGRVAEHTLSSAKEKGAASKKDYYNT